MQVQRVLVQTQRMLVQAQRMLCKHEDTSTSVEGHKHSSITPMVGQLIMATSGIHVIESKVRETQV